MLLSWLGQLMQFDHLKRRELIALLSGAAAAWSLAARAQQPAMPVIGYLSTLSEAQASHMVAAFRGGLNEAGFVEGTNAAIEYRWADGQYDRLPAMAADLVRRSVALIAAQAPPAALAARTATTTIPIVFVVGLDPVGAGLVASFNRPGGNATGITLITGPLGQKRLELVRELTPKAAAVAMLVNPFSPDAPPEIRDVQAAAQAIGIELKIFHASTPGEIDAAFVAIAAQRPDALLVGSDPFFVLQRDRLVALAARLPVPSIYPFREFTASGGLISYGTNIANSFRQAGVYASRILKGAKPAELPVMQPTIFELVINLKTAKTLGIDMTPNLHARADEVIE
jgi:putative tryptophan/tyrosine transport system substrate-binding protein